MIEFLSSSSKVYICAVVLKSVQAQSRVHRGARSALYPGRVQVKPMCAIAIYVLLQTNKVLYKNGRAPTLSVLWEIHK